MKKIIRIITTLAVLAIVGLNAVPAYASDLAQAQYMRNLVVTNTGAETQNNVVTFDPATLEMVTSGLINSSLTGSAITDLAGNDLIYMPKEPVRYKLVQYLESNGTQYIDTGYVPNANTKWVGDVAFTTTPDAQLSGLYDTTSGTAARFDLYSSYQGSIYPLYGNGTIPGAVINPITIGTHYTFTLDAKNQFASVNSASNTSWPALSGTFSQTVYLFARNNTGSVGGYSNIRLYSSQIYDNGVLVRDFVPAQRTTDDVLGLLDRVNNVFYTNKGTGTFTTAQYSTTYYICDYISTTNGQTEYIDTNYYPNNNTNFNLALAFPIETSGNARWVLGGRTAYQSAEYALIAENSYVRACYGNNRSSISVSSVQYVSTYYNKWLIDGTSVTTTANTWTNTYKMYLFALNNAGTFSAGGGEKNVAISHMDITENNVIKRNFIAVYNPTSQQAGMFDNVNNVWYGNAGTGTFDYKLSGNDGTWCLYLPTVAANTSLQERLYISTENLNSKIAYFPGTSGLIVNRNTSNTVSGSDDWNFTIKGNFISGDGSYLFKYGDDLYATLNGNTITFAYGTITIPTSAVNHNTLWGFYYGTQGSVTLGGSPNASISGTYYGTYANSDNSRMWVSLRATLSNNPYNMMIVKATTYNTSTTGKVGYNSNGSYSQFTSSQNYTNNALTTMTLPTGSTIYPLIFNQASSTGQSMYARAYLWAFAKADNPAQYGALTRYGANASAMISNSTNMLNDLAAVITLSTKCTGDFMWACVKSSTFTNALASSPYKDIITSSEDWAKALAWNTGSYSTTSPNSATVSLSTTQTVPVGYHTYDFRKEGNSISIYVDSNLVRGGIFNETSYYTAITALGYTYSQVASYDTDAQIVFAQGGTTLYADQIQQKKNGNNVGQWSWAQTDTFTFPDLSSQGNTGYPSFRDTNYGTVDNGANLSISYGIYQPANVAQYDAPGSSEASTFTGLLPEIEQPEQDVDLGRIQNVPFASVFEDLLDAGGIPSQLFWLPIMMTFAIAACGVAYHLTRDALISCIAGDVMLGLGCALSVLYTVPLVIGIVTTIVLLVKRKTISL